MDLHQGQIQGFFNIPVDELTAVHLLSNYFIQQGPRRPGRGHGPRLRQARAHLRRAARRAAGDHREAAPGQRSTGPRCSTSSARSRASGPSSSTTRSTPPARSWRSPARCEREGVTEIYACATHGVLSDPAVDRIRDSNLTEVVVTDTIPLPPAKQLRKIKVLSVAPLDRRGHQPHPRRRVGRRPLLVGDPAGPGDAPLGRCRATTRSRPFREPPRRVR